MEQQRAHVVVRCDWQRFGEGGVVIGQSRTDAITAHRPGDVPGVPGLVGLVEERLAHAPPDAQQLVGLCRRAKLAQPHRIVAQKHHQARRQLRGPLFRQFRADMRRGVRLLRQRQRLPVGPARARFLRWAQIGVLV